MVERATGLSATSVLAVVCVALCGLWEPSPGGEADSGAELPALHHVGGHFVTPWAAPGPSASDREDHLTQQDDDRRRSPQPAADTHPETLDGEDRSREDDQSREEERNEELDDKEWRPPTRGSGGDDPPDYIKSPDPELVLNLSRDR